MIRTYEWPEGCGFPRHVHAHNHTIEVVSGKIDIQCDGLTRRYQAGDKITLEAGHWHTVRAASPSIILTDHDVD